jgi:hypothetical protein
LESSSCSKDSSGLQEVRVAPGMTTGNPSPEAMVAVAIVEPLLAPQSTPLAQ